ncbi:MAG TPA: transcriptional repressor [Candidatus Merdisoma merdipullorum]|uniref:Transcriptional repressor n=1 Tax=Candidatus Enterocloster excrementipullorum TaxID=2838559 RepID=A0A9D2SHD3_9FIRM|nr:transcriptional repressor [Candidatus Merdisoma merdipullorum]HJC05123.1 transcriptional repressor [Candidatus Enterocloster excrementipullorum]
MTDQKEMIISELQKNGKRITDQRRILLDVILEGKWSSCKEIYYMASKRDPSIGLATVYRMVAVLEEMGFLRKGYRYYYPGSKRGEEKEVF